MSKEELTIDDIKEFCKSQIIVVESKWKDMSVEDKRKAELIPYHTVYKILLDTIEAPKVAREVLEKELIRLTR